MTTLQKIREIVIRSNPDKWKSTPMCRYCMATLVPAYGTGKISFEFQCMACGSYQEAVDEPIRLTDILLALSGGHQFSKQDAYMSETIMWPDILKDLIPLWNLADDNLDNASEECKDLILKYFHAL